MSKRILVLGGSGMIGSKIVNYISTYQGEIEFTFSKNNIPLAKGRHHLDITEKEDTLQLITQINPDIVIHTVALAGVDLCETNKLLAYSVNVTGTKNVIEACKKTKSKIVYVSTSYVFDGKKNKYDEEDIPSPPTYYGITKHLAEEQIKNSGLDYLILRTDQPYCWTEPWQRTNSVIRVIQTLKSNQILKEIIDWYNNPTYVPNFVEATIKLINNSETGIFHLVGSDFINRFDWSCMVADVFNLNKKLITPITSNSLNLPAKRYNVNLINLKLFKKTNIRMIGVRDGLLSMLNESVIK